MEAYVVDLTIFNVPGRRYTLIGCVTKPQGLEQSSECGELSQNAKMR
jgi:hypothetical protein